MSDEGLTSIPVVDNAFNVVGNISTADVKLLTNSASLPLLQATCIHFVSVILSERGVNDGKDSFPGTQIQASTSLENFTYQMQFSMLAPILLSVTRSRSFLQQDHTECGL